MPELTVDAALPATCLDHVDVVLGAVRELNVRTDAAAGMPS